MSPAGWGNDDTPTIVDAVQSGKSTLAGVGDTSESEQARPCH